MADRYYLSDKDLADRLAEMPGDGAEDSCGGWTYDPPCGGCSACIRAQQVYYFMRERDWARKVQAAGLELANTRIDIGYHFGKSHSAYSCWCANERTELSFPWEKLTV